MATIANRSEYAKKAEELLEKFPLKTGGEIVKYGEEKYDEVLKGYYALQKARPLFFVLAKGVADVKRTVKFARAAGVEMAIRGGGHSPVQSSNVEGGVVLHLGEHMNQVRVDPDEGVAYCQGGATLGDLDREVSEFGFCVPTGQVSCTGIGGLTLGGGYSCLSRKLGLMIDSLLEVEMVTADGEFVRANADTNSDLFWGVRGGGSNFGVVTTYKFKLHPSGNMHGGIMFYFWEHSEEVVRYISNVRSTVSKNLCLNVFFFPGLPGTPFAEKKVIAVRVAYSGEDYEGEAQAVVQHLREGLSGKPFMDTVKAKTWEELNADLNMAAVKGKELYMTAIHLNRWDEEVGLYVRKRWEDFSDEFPMLLMLENHDGQVNEVDKSSTAIPHRHTSGSVMFQIAFPTNPKAEEIIANSRAFLRKEREKLIELGYADSFGVMTNYNSDNQTDITYAESYQKLKELKKKYDPENFFHFNHNITPN